jgi:hypothetical protein
VAAWPRPLTRPGTVIDDLCQNEEET